VIGSTGEHRKDSKQSLKAEGRQDKTNEGHIKESLLEEKKKEGNVRSQREKRAEKFPNHIQGTCAARRPD
jgi:hypothetical protein